MSDLLIGRRILVVEDSPLVADASVGILEDLGCIVVGPTGNMADALHICETAELDAAVVDVNIRGAKAFPVLRILERRQIPFVLTSGYANWSMPEEWSERPRVNKPYTASQLSESLEQLLTKTQG